MALTVSDRRSGATALPTWARPPAPEAPGSTRRGVLTRAATAAVVAAGMVALGHRTGAAVLVVVFTTVSLVSWRVPSVARRIERFLARFQHGVGRVLTVVVLTVVYVVVFVPPAIVLRLLRRDALALGSRAGDASFWRPAARARRPLHRHTYTNERHRPAPSTSARRRPFRTALAVVGCLALLAAIDLGVGLATVPEPPALAEAPEPDGPVLNAPDVAARDGEPWAAALYPELGEAYDQAEYHPYRGWSVPDYRGDWVTVEDEVRLSYETSLPGPAVDVFFFGGSTMMGWIQRNEHTIPSEVVRLAEADGIAVQAFNYGQPAYSHWQEVMLLQELVSEGRVPDLAVFYDGANELGAQFRSGPSQDPIHLQARATQERLDQASADTTEADRVSAPTRLLDAYLDTSAVARVSRSSPVANVAQQVVGDDEPMGPLWPDQAERPRDRGRAAGNLYRRGVDLGMSLSEGYGFEAAWFWQPIIYSRDAAPGEEDVVGSWGTDPEAWTAAYEEARGMLAEPVVDLGDALDDLREPIYYDFIHTNERGARAMAEAIYEQLKPRLLDLQAGMSR